MSRIDNLNQSVSVTLIFVFAYKFNNVAAAHSAAAGTSLRALLECIFPCDAERGGGNIRSHAHTAVGITKKAEQERREKSEAEAKASEEDNGSGADGTKEAEEDNESGADDTGEEEKASEE